MHHPEQAHDLPVVLFDKGWYKFAHQLASPNFGARPADVQINLIVIHSISLPPGQYGGDEVQQLFTNTLDWNAHPYFEKIRGAEVSAHFYIRRNGELWQFVSCDERAWHAGKSSFMGKDNCNDYSIGIELEGLEGDSFEPAQYESLASVSAALQQNYPIVHLTGHEHIAPGRKADPGPQFDWQQVRKAW
ncbi:MAG: putative amidase protein [Pseudomonadota bacterium]